MKKQKKAILHIIDSLGVGGAEKLLVGIINELNDFDNHLIILNDPEILLNKLRDDIKFKNVKWNSILQIKTKARAIRQYIRDNNIDIVHSHLYLSNIFARLATPKGIPLFNSIHSIPSVDIYKSNKLILWFDKLTYKKHHHIIAVSNEVFNDFNRCVGVKGRGTVLYNFIENKFWRNTGKKSFASSSLKLVSVGNLRYPKNYPFVIEAFKTMPEGVTLDIFGEGEMRNTLQKQIDEFKLRVRLCGTCSDLESILPQYDAFLMTSFYEGQPVSLLEAMACGLPSLLSDIPVLREVAGDTALYFNIDDPQNLVQLIKSIQSGKFNLTELSEKSLQRVERIAKKEHYIEKLRHLYLTNSNDKI